MGDNLYGVSGIYAIECADAGRQYVGSAISVGARWKSHRYLLTRGTHHSPRLQNAWAKYGADAFRLVILELVPDRTTLIAREQFWMDHLEVAHKGFNVLPHAGSQLGAIRSAQARANMSVAQRRRMAAERAAGIVRERSVMSPKGRARVAAAHRGTTASTETRAKMSATRLGRKRPPEVGAKVSAAKRGTKHSDAALAKMRAAKLGKKLTAEAKAKMSAVRRGRKHAPAHAAKLAAILTESNRRRADARAASARRDGRS